MATETEASVAGPAASADTEVKAAVITAIGTGQRRRKNDSAKASSPSPASSRKSRSPCRSATVSQTAALIASASAVRHTWLHAVSRGW